MAMSRLLSISHHLKSLKPYFPFTPFASASRIRFLSYATPEEAAADRRRRKRRLRIEPASSLVHQKQSHPVASSPNPSAPKPPESILALSGSRLVLHNRILDLIRENDLDEAASLTRHSVYSNCQPTIFTSNAVLRALLLQSRHADLLSLHRFITQSNIAPTIITFNLLIQSYCDCGRTGVALENFRLLLKDDALFPPAPSTWRILAKGLVDNGKLQQAVELKDEMLAKAFMPPDPIVYNHIMQGFIKNGVPETAITLYEELQEKLGGKKILNGIVYGNLMKGYFGKKMEEQAMEIYRDVLGDGSKVKFDAMSYNLVLDALGRNGKLEEAINLFGRMLKEHNPPRRTTVDLGTFNVMIDGYCLAGRFQDAVMVFGQMSEQQCTPDTQSYNNLIGHLGSNKLVAEAEELYKEMSDDRRINPDECTYGLLVEACFGVNRADDATAYFHKMEELGLRPNANSYNKVIGGLVKIQRLDDADKFFDQMLEKEVKPNVTSYELLLRGFLDARRLDDGLKILKGLFLDDGVAFSEQMKEFVDEVFREEGREEELEKLYEDLKREKAEQLAREAEERARAEALAKEEQAKKKREDAENRAAAARACVEAMEVMLRYKKDVTDKESPADGSSAPLGGLFGEEKTGNHLLYKHETAGGIAEGEAP